MHYTKAMIDLLKELRRRAPADLKPSIKLANPEVFGEIRRLYFVSDDAVFKALVRALFEMAGPPWDAALKVRDEEGSKPQSDGYILKSYRGVTELLDRAEQSHKPPREQSKKKVYRGQIIRS